MEDMQIEVQILKAIQMVPPFRSESPAYLAADCDPRWAEQLQIFRHLQRDMTDGQSLIMADWKTKFNPIFVDWIFGMFLLEKEASKNSKNYVDYGDLLSAVKLLKDNSLILSRLVFNYFPLVKINFLAPLFSILENALSKSLESPLGKKHSDFSYAIMDYVFKAQNLVQNDLLVDLSGIFYGGSNNLKAMEKRVSRSNDKYKDCIPTYLRPLASTPFQKF